MHLSMNGRLSIKARVTAWFAIIMFIIASAVFYVMIMHRTSQVKTDAERSLVSSVGNFADMVERTGGDFLGFEDSRPRADSKPNGGSLPQLDKPQQDNNTPPQDKVLSPEGENNLLPKENTHSQSNNDNNSTNGGPLLRNGTTPPQGGPDDSKLSGGDGRKPRTYAGGVHMALYDENGETLFGQIPFELENIDFVDGQVRSLTSNSERYMVLDRKVETDSGSLWVKGVMNISGALNAVNATLAADYALITALIIIAAIGGYFIVGKALAPISKMRRTAQEIADSSDLSRRINLGQGKDEVYRLAAVFDEMLDKIERSFESEKQFTSDASHELRTPVAVILSECEYALDCAKTDEEFKDSLAVVKRQGDKMSKLISELLTISRMDKNNLIPNLEETDISELLEIVCDEQKELKQNGITLFCDIEPNVRAMADSALIARLFINLISNAFQYGKEGGSVHVSLKKEGANFLFSVTDDGIGIAEEDIPKIWERFYQVNKSRTNENGSMGLGLSMVKQIAGLHRGQVHVKSTPGKGSTFTFTMPAGM